MASRGGAEHFGRKVCINPRFYRPAEVDLLIVSPKKGKAGLGWRPQIGIEELCAMMVKADIEQNKARNRASGRKANELGSAT